MAWIVNGFYCFIPGLLTRASRNVEIKETREERAFIFIWLMTTSYEYAEITTFQHLRQSSSTQS